MEKRGENNLSAQSALNSIEFNALMLSGLFEAMTETIPGISENTIALGHIESAMTSIRSLYIITKKLATEEQKKEFEKKMDEYLHQIDRAGKNIK